MLLYLLFSFKARRSLNPIRREFDLYETPRTTSDLLNPLGSRVISHLEEWSWEDQGDDHEDLTLGDDVLQHLEEWSCEDQDDDHGNLNGSDARTALTMTTIALSSDVEHPLWDRELDG